MKGILDGRDEEIRAALEAAGGHGGIAARALRVHPSSVNRWRNRVQAKGSEAPLATIADDGDDLDAAELGEFGTRPVLPGFAIKGTSTQLGPEGQMEREWVRQAKRHGPEFEVPAGHVVKGVSALVDERGRQIQRWVKTKEGLTPVDAVAAIREVLSGMTERAAFVPAPVHTIEDLATVYVAADWHVGLLSWGRETGTDYDLPIAQQVIGDAVGRLVDGSPASSQAVVLGLGDLLHSDGYDPVTSRSKNVLDVDGRYPKVLRAATLLLVTTINLALAKHDSVLVRILPGNHDDQSSIAVALALELHYAGNPRVAVDDDPGAFWWWSWGRVFLGATHGDQAKMRDLPLIMASRNPEAWGRSAFRHIYTGHIHTQTGLELSGVTVESFQTPAAPDAWHARMGYGASRSMTSVTLHRERGEISRQKVNIVSDRVAA